MADTPNPDDFFGRLGEAKPAAPGSPRAGMEVNAADHRVISRTTQAVRDVDRVSILNAELAKASASAAAGSESAADDVEALRREIARAGGARVSKAGGIGLGDASRSAPAETAVKSRPNPADYFGAPVEDKPPEPEKPGLMSRAGTALRGAASAAGDAIGSALDVKVRPTGSMGPDTSRPRSLSQELIENARANSAPRQGTQPGVLDDEALQQAQRERQDPVLNPAFLAQLREDFAALPEQERLPVLREMAAGGDVYGKAARIILRQVEGENAAGRDAAQRRPQATDILMRAGPQAVEGAPGSSRPTAMPELGTLRQLAAGEGDSASLRRSGAERALLGAGQAGVLDPSKREPKSPGMLGHAADTGLQLAQGVVQGGKMLADTFGAGNPAAETLKAGADWLASNFSDQLKWEQLTSAQDMKAAELSGSSWEEIKAAGRTFGRDPVGFLVNAAGTSIPTIAAAFLPFGQGAALGRLAAMGMMGAAQGAGSVKGQIYEEVQKAWQKHGASTDEAKTRASAAQAYLGSSAGQIALGTALGVVAGGGVPGLGGVESAIAAKMAGTAAGKAATGMIPRFASQGANEAIPEAAQGGQERLASNLALQQEGFDQSTWGGVAGGATLEALAGFGVGAVSSPLTRPNAPVAGASQRKAETFSRLDDFAAEYGLKPSAVDAIKKASDSVPLAALPAVIKKAVVGLGQRGVFKGPTDEAALSALDAIDPAGSLLGGETAPKAKAEAATVDPELALAPDAAAALLDDTEVRADDLLTRDEQPYGTKASAQARATREGGGDLVEVVGGWVVRQKESGDEPVNNLATPAQQPVDAGAVAGDQSDRSRGDAGRVAPDGGRRDPTTVQAPVASGGEAAPAGPADRADGALTQPAVERRTNAAQRQRVADMNQEQLREALLTDHLTGIGNRRAYDEAPRRAFQASLDVDALKSVNDLMGHPSGDKLIAALGPALKDLGIDSYHISGDEFIAQFDDETSGHEAMAKVRDVLASTVITAQLPDGSTVTKTGVEFSYGIAKDIAGAEHQLQADKAAREASGQRVPRGGEPRGLVKTPAPGQQDQERAGAKEVVSIVAPGAGAPAVGGRPEADGGQPDAALSDDPFAVLFGADYAKLAPYKAPIDSEAIDAEGVRRAVSEARVRVQAQFNDWSGRTYKANKAQVELKGDGPRRNPSMSIGAINEGRRRKALDALEQEMKAMDAVEAILANPTKSRQFARELRTLQLQADTALKSGNFPHYKDAGAMFESMFLNNMLKLRGPGGRGNYESNEVSRAVRAALETKPKERAQPTPDAAAPATTQATAQALAPGSGLTKIGRSKSATTNSFRDSPPGNAKLFANIDQAEAFREHGLRGLDIPSQRVVISKVVNHLHDPEIVGGVVQLVPVDVVHNLVGKKGSAESLLSDPSVLKKLSAINSDDSIAVAVDGADTIVRAVASVIAKQVGGPGGGERLFAGLPTMGAAEEDASPFTSAATKNAAPSGEAAGKDRKIPAAAGTSKIDGTHSATSPSSDVSGAEVAQTTSALPILGAADAFELGQSRDDVIRAMAGNADLFAEPGPAAKTAQPETLTDDQAFADNFARFDGKTLTQQVMVADTGQTATLKMDAGKAMREQASRLESLRSLRACLGAA